MCLCLPRMRAALFCSICVRALLTCAFSGVVEHACLGSYFNGESSLYCVCVCVYVCVCGGGGQRKFLTAHPSIVLLLAHIAPLPSKPFPQGVVGEVRHCPPGLRTAPFAIHSATIPSHLQSTVLH